MKTLDTRELAKLREELKQEVLDSFLETFEHYEEQTDSYEDILMEEEEIQEWKKDWQEEIDHIEEIDYLEDNIKEFSYGETMIHVDDWVDYVQELLQDCGDIPRNLPHYIEIDWKATADNIEVDYSEIDYQGESYYYRSV